MQATTEPFQDIESRIAYRERLSLIFTAVIAVAFVTIAAGFLAFTYHSLNNLRAELQSSNEKLADVNAERERVQNEVADVRRQLAEVNGVREEAQRDVAKLQEQVQREKEEAEKLKIQLIDSTDKLTQLEDQIRESADFARYLHPIDFADAKELFNLSPALGDLLVTILRFRDRNIPFSFANNPNTGFTSPGFAGYILQQLGKAPIGTSPDSVIRGLPPAPEARLGDIIRYETGFALFYLQDRRRSPFVIGMTPKGIAALNVNFGAKRIGVLRTGLYSGIR